MGFVAVPLDFVALTNQAPVWDGGTVNNSTVFKSDVSVEGTLTTANVVVNGHAEINEGLDVRGGMAIDTLDVGTDLLVGATIYMGERDVVNKYFRIRMVASVGLYVDELTATNTWTERGFIGAL